MRTADLYVRVNTGEQAEKGYSQHDQEEQLQKYCDQNDIVVHKIIYEF
jgi:DNA invertase Pin-like site-specific DNA recombinase